MTNASNLTDIQIYIEEDSKDINLTESQNDALFNYVEQLSAHGIQFKVVDSIPRGLPYYLKYSDGALSLIDINKNSELSLDWAKELKSHIRKRYAVSKEPLFRALKLKGDDISYNAVVDATLGTGKDACLLLSFKCRLLCFERNPYVFCLGLWAYIQACEDSDAEIANIFRNQMSLRFGEAIDSTIDPEYERCFFDPMYEITKSKNKSALSRKEMETFKSLVGSDEDQGDILQQLCSKFKLVCFKRPIKAPQIQIGSDFKCQKVVYTGKSTRYERYFLP